MEAIETFKEVLTLLNNEMIVMSKNKLGLTYFALYKDKVRVHNEFSNYIISIYELKDLFLNEKFYLYESDLKEEFVSKQKDDEYYGWRHK